MQDIRTTIDKVRVEVCWVFAFVSFSFTDLYRQLSNLHIRSGFEYYLIGSRSDVSQLAAPTVLMTVNGGDFFTQYMKCDPVKLPKYFEAFCNSNAGLNGLYFISSHRLLLTHELYAGLVRHVAKSEHKGDTKTALKSLVMDMLRKVYGASIHAFILYNFLIRVFSETVVGRSSFRFNWGCYAAGKADSNNIRLVGWPLKTKPVALSSIGTVAEMRQLYFAVANDECYFKKDDDADASDTPALSGTLSASLPTSTALTFLSGACSISTWRDCSVVRRS